MLGNNGKTGCVAIQTVGTAKNEGFSLFFIIISQGICQGILIIGHGRMNGHSGGLIYNNDVFIFINDIER